MTDNCKQHLCFKNVCTFTKANSQNQKRDIGTSVEIHKLSKIFYCYQITLFFYNNNSFVITTKCTHIVNILQWFNPVFDLVKYKLKNDYIRYKTLPFTIVYSCGYPYGDINSQSPLLKNKKLMKNLQQSKLFHSLKAIYIMDKNTSW